jgi:RNA polymerase sigma-70 factor (ECF subfamily)
MKAIRSRPCDISAESLVDEYGASLYKFCRSLAYTKEDAEDLFQETFLRVFEQLPKIRGSDNPQSFLFSASIFVWKSQKRKHARRKRLAPAEPLPEAVSAGGIGLEETLLAEEEISVVRGLVDALPEKLKIPIILYYTNEMSVSDIALTLRLPAGTIKSRLFKARKLIEKGLVAEYEK